MRRFICVAAVVLAGCDAVTYSPDSDPPLTDLDSEARTLPVDLLGAPDTLLFVGRQYLAFQVGSNRKSDVISVEVSIGDHAFPSTLIDSAEIPDGTYPLRMRVTASAATGSLADLFGYETQEVVIERVAVVENANPAVIAPTALGPSGGFLTVRWDHYPQRNVKAFEVFTWRDEGRWGLAAQLTDPAATSWADSTFLAGPVAIRVDVVTMDGRRSEGEVIDATYEAPAVVAEVLPGERVGLTWTATPFVGVFGHYEIVEQGPAAWDPRALTGTASDTTAVIEAGYAFGASNTYSVWVVGDRDKVEGQPTTVRFDATSPLRTPVVALGRTGAVVGRLTVGDRLGRYDASTLALTASSGSLGDVAALVTSPGGRLVAFVQRRGRWYAVDLDPRTLLIRSEVALMAVPSLVRPGVTDAGEVVFLQAASTSSAVGPTVVAVDLATGAVVGRIDAPDTYNSLRLIAVSGSEGHVLVGETLWARDPTAPSGYRSLGLVGTTGTRETRVDDAVFTEDGRLLVLDYYGAQRVLVIDPPSTHATAQWPTPGGPEIRYDPASGLVMLVGDGWGETALAVFVDPATGRGISQLRTAVSTSFAAGFVWGEGVYRPVVAD